MALQGGVINYITKKPGEGAANVMLSQSIRSSLVKAEDSIGYVAKLSQEKYGVQRDADEYGLSDSRQRDAFVKLAYQLDDEQSLQLSYNYYDSDQDAKYHDVAGNIDLGEKTYAVPLTTGEVVQGAPQGHEGNYNLMLKYQHNELFSNTGLVVDAYRQKIDNVFFWSATLANPEQEFDGGQSAILSEKDGLSAVLTSAVTLVHFSPNADGFDTGDQGPVKSYDVLNLSANYQKNNWQLFAGIESLLNEAYFPARSQSFRYGTGYSVKGLSATLNMGVSYTF